LRQACRRDKLYDSQIQETQEWSRDISHFLATFNAFGAAISYTTLFSATRGSLVLMSWSFTTFFVAFLLPAGCQGVLGWAAAVPSNIRFTSRRKYHIIIGVAIFFSSMSTIVAVFLLLCSVYHLHVPGDPPQAGPHEDPQHLTGAALNSSVKWSSALAMVVMSSIFAVFFMVNLLVLWGNGWKRFTETYCHFQHNLHKKYSEDTNDRIFPW